MRLLELNSPPSHTAQNCSPYILSQVLLLAYLGQLPKFEEEGNSQALVTSGTSRFRSATPAACVVHGSVWPCGPQSSPHRAFRRLRCTFRSKIPREQRIGCQPIDPSNTPPLPAKSSKSSLPSCGIVHSYFLVPQSAPDPSASKLLLGRCSPFSLLSGVLSWNSVRKSLRNCPFRPLPTRNGSPG